MITDTVAVQLLTGPQELAALAAECDELARAMRPRLPFATSSWLTLWWQHYRENRLLVRDHFFVHTLRDAQGRLIALAPLLLTERPGTGPLRSRALTFFGGDKNVTELRGLVCAPEHEARAVRALLAHLARRGNDWDWFVWNGVRRDSEAHAALSGVASFEWTRETTDYVLPLPASWAEFRAGRSRNIKESLRKCYNSLKRDGHAFTRRVVSEPAELSAALRRFFELHEARASARELAPHANVFAVERARGLVSDLAASSTEALSVHVFRLEIAGNVVASRLGFVLGDELYLYFSGYDPAWGKYSVMTTLVAEAIQWAIERQLRLVNLSPGTDVSKTRWGATGITTCDGVLHSPLRRGRLVFDLMTQMDARSRTDGLLGRLASRARRLG